MSELPAGVPRAVEPEPLDSSSAVVLADGPRVLLGVRSRRARFMPGHLAFPGGVLEPADGPGTALAFARCVSRELTEETGLEIPLEHWFAAGERVTPPMFPVRFRTRFFVAAWPSGVGADRLQPATPENESLRLARPQEALDEWSAGRVPVPPPVLPVLRALAQAGPESLAAAARRLEAVNEREQRAPRIEFAPQVWMLPLRTATLPPATHTNAWMPGGSRFVIIDPGTADEPELQRLLEVIARRRKLGQEPAAVLLTHHHQDHVTGAAALARELRLGIRAHASVLDQIGRAAPDVSMSSLDDGECIDLGGMTLEALHTPGHAAGHLAFWLAQPRLLVAGDLVGGMSTILIDPDSGDMDLYLASLERVRELGARLLLPGHGPPLPARQLERLIEHRLRREATIAGQLDSSPVTLAEIARSTYEDVPQMPPVLTEKQTLAHLIRLERHGRARRADDAGSRWCGTGGRA